MATATTKYNSCKLKFGDPWVKNTRYVHSYGANGQVADAKLIKGQEAVDFLTLGLNWWKSQGHQANVDAYAASIQFAQENPTAPVPNPLFNPKKKAFDPFGFTACMN